MRTQGGTLVVPPGGPADAEKGSVQTILPLGALVECLGCSIEWSKRRGLRVKHPTLGTLRTGVSGNTCPYIQEQQALQLIAELEATRLGEFRHQLQTFECQLEAQRDQIDPSEAWRKFASTGDRKDALGAIFAQPYLQDAPENQRAALAEAIPVDKDGRLDGKRVLKALPLRRSSRKLLLNSDRWVVHLCSGKPRARDPIQEWCERNGMLFLHVDILERGGKGWDLLGMQGIWRALLWAASEGKIAAILSSPPKYRDGEQARLPLQAMTLWSFASVMRGRGIPYLAEHPCLPPKIQEKFGRWSGTKDFSLSQGALGDEYARPTAVQTNLKFDYVSTLKSKGNPGVPPDGRVWTLAFREEIVRALSGTPSMPSCAELDRIIVQGRRTAALPEATTAGEAQEDDPLRHVPLEQDSLEPSSLGSRPQVGKVSDRDLEGWREHILNGHVPYRKDCRRCVEGVGVQHRKVKYPQSYALSADLFGPVPPDERGRDETCVSGNSYLRYALVGAFRVPRSVIEPKDQQKDAEVVPTQEDLSAWEGIDLAEYEPSEVPEETMLHEEDQELRQLFELPNPEDQVRGEVPLSVGAVDGSAAAAEGEGTHDKEPPDIDDGVAPEDPEKLKELVQQLRDPVEQVVLRYVIPLKGKSGPEVTEGIQKMILAINARFPVRVLHTDPGTEFMSGALSKWLAGHGVRVQHSLPTDKKGNGLAERTVGWVKSRIRTLIGSSEYSPCFWPLAARWAAEAHNRSVLGLPRLPAFGQQVLHRIKQPADGIRQIMNRWIVARYAAPHSSITEGHVLVTEEGNLVASRGFRANTIDPAKLEDIRLPVLHELEPGALSQEEATTGEAATPERRLRSKTTVRFVECTSEDDPESYARECILNGRYTRGALKGVLSRLPREVVGHRDRRGVPEDRFVLGAYCHGGLRGLTTNTKRFPFTTRFLNECMQVTLEAQDTQESPSWTALLIARASDVGVHKDFRNEWGSLNHVFAVPGAVELWRSSAEEVNPEQPNWATGQVDDLNESPISFNARNPHAVRKHPDWILVAYTPLGSAKLRDEDWASLQGYGFRTPLRGNLESVQVKAVSSGRGSPEPSQEEEHGGAQASGSSELPPAIQGSLEVDCQPDSYTPIIGWDATNGPGAYPRWDLQRTDLFMYLRERYAEHELERLSHHGVEEPADLPFLYEEDLLEMGIPTQVVRRIMFGIHPPGTIRPDSPAVLGQRTGEVRMFDRSQRQIPWIIQNRTLAQRQPGPPIEGLGVRRFEGDNLPEDEDRDPLRIPEEIGADPTDSPRPQVQEERASSSSEPWKRPHAADLATEDQLHMMYMQSMWDDDEPDVVYWPQAASSSGVGSGATTHTADPGGQAASSSSMFFANETVPFQGRPSTELSLGVGLASEVGVENNVNPEEIDADPTDSPQPQVPFNYECRTVRSGGPLKHSECRTVRSGGPWGSSPVRAVEAEGPQAAQVATGPLRIGVPLDAPLTALRLSARAEDTHHVSRSRGGDVYAKCRGFVGDP